jgi:hypothetical protein
LLGKNGKSIEGCKRSQCIKTPELMEKAPIKRHSHHGVSPKACKPSVADAVDFRVRQGSALLGFSDQTFEVRGIAGSLDMPATCAACHVLKRDRQLEVDVF